MYTSNEINYVSIQWTIICRHIYQRLSRTKWQIDFEYKCGAEMHFDGIPDDMIQCLVLGAYNSKKEMETNLGKVKVPDSIQLPIFEWKDLQFLIVS